MENNHQYSLILLAGGKSSRMGRNKAELTIDGKSFVQMLLEKSAKLGLAEIYLSGILTENPDVTAVPDIFKERGPLGGIHACMKQVKTPYCLILPVDVPQIPVEVLKKLLEKHKLMPDKSRPLILKHGGRRENLIGIYPIVMIDHIETLIKEHPASVHGML